MYELQKLCDDVPRFDNAIAKKIFLDELGQNFEDVFDDISLNPVAAASVG